MPKEYVYGIATVLPPGPQDSGSTRESIVGVGWGRDQGMVQLGTVYDRDSYDPCLGVYVDLDRNQINKLIRVLRRARDQAFGRDE